MKIAVLNNCVPFLRGGAEHLADALVSKLAEYGHQAMLVRVPFRWDPPDKIVDHMLACRLMRNVTPDAPYPAEPSKPIPMRVMLLAIVGGIFVGGVLMLGREYLDRSVHDVRELRSARQKHILQDQSVESLEQRLGVVLVGL